MIIFKPEPIVLDWHSINQAEIWKKIARVFRDRELEMVTKPSAGSSIISLKHAGKTVYYFTLIHTPKWREELLKYLNEYVQVGNYSHFD